MSEPIWTAAAVAFRYPGRVVDALAGVDAVIASAELTALLGPNGAGKSTFARLLVGLAAPSRGEVRWLGRPVCAWPRGELARQIGFVPQGEQIGFPLRAREVVAMGRYPHLGPWRAEGEADRRIVLESLADVEATELAGRQFDALSGGERQRVRIARALAQRGSALVLDEPSAGLDVRHEVELFVLCRRLATAGHAVVIVTHNLSLAARLADRVLLFDSGRLAAAGAPADVLSAPTLSTVYGWPVDVLSHPGPGQDRGSPLVVPRIAVTPRSDATGRTGADAA